LHANQPGTGLHLLLYKAAGVRLAQQACEPIRQMRVGFVFVEPVRLQPRVFSPADRIFYQEEP
jgi:hypothetical protein